MDQKPDNGTLPTVCVFGMGYVGLTLAAVMSDAGYPIVGIDHNAELVTDLKHGKPHFHERGLEELLEQLATRPSAPVYQSEITAPVAQVYIPPATTGTPPAVSGAPRYTLRQFEAADRARYFRLLAAADMAACPLENWERHILPDGFFVIHHDATGALVATCFASHHPAPRHPRAGNLGWLAADPAHKGHQLGRSVAAAVTTRLVAGGYRRIYLETHDFRIPTIRVYLRMGWAPLLYQADMHYRWEAVCKAARWPFTPDEWAA